MELGFLEEVNVRELWKHEQYDFSNWLAKEKSMELLGDVLGLTLTDVDNEVYVGSYRCDLVAKDEATGIKVIIENQLEASNHDHLGKLITYASGLDASVIVWIVTQAREEHRSAVEWLNNNTNENLSFFLLELHAYKIGNSLPAPKFETIEKPNGFIKSSKGNTGGGNTAMGEAEAQRLEFWTQFNEVVDSKGKPFNKRKATTDHWYNVAIGSSDANISIDLVNKEHKIRVSLWISDNKDIFDTLLQKKDEIEEALGFALEWNRLDSKKASYICTYIKGLDFKKQENYPMLMEQIVDLVLKMRNVFPKFM